MKLYFILYLIIFIHFITGCAIQPRLVKTTDANMDEIKFAKLIAQKRGEFETESRQVSPCKFTVPVNCKFGYDAGIREPYRDLMPEKKIINDFENFCKNNKKGVHQSFEKNFKCLNDDGTPIFVWSYSKEVRNQSRIRELNNSLHVFGTVFINLEKEPLPNIINESAEFMHKIDVKPLIKDDSGFYGDDTLISWTKKIKNLDCTTNLSNIEYVVNIETLKTPFSVSLENHTFFLTHDSEYTVKPTIHIKEKKFNTLYTKKKYENKDLAITVNKISSHPIVHINITNKSDKYISLKTFSLHMNDSILTTSSFDIKSELPPQSSKDSTILFKSSEAKNTQIFSEVKNDIDIVTTRERAKNTTYYIGVSIKYQIENKTETLYKIEKFNLLDLLSQFSDLND